MKSATASWILPLIVVSWMIVPQEALPQNSRVEWSAISSGFGVPGSSTSVVKSSAGQVVVGRSQLSNSLIESGFLAFYGPHATSCKTSIKVLLQGPYNTGTGLMSTTLRASGILASHFTGRPIPSQAVDSITIELRNTASAPTTRKFRRAWLLADGTIRDFTDTTASYVTFDTLAGNYYLVMRHRNHLATMTAAAQALNGAVPAAAYDFTTAQSQAYGTNPMQALAVGKFGLYAGDANASAVVTAADANGVFGVLSGTGYDPNDINLSGIITAADANIVFGNLNVGEQVPVAPARAGRVQDSSGLVE